MTIVLRELLMIVMAIRNAGARQRRTISRARLSCTPVAGHHQRGNDREQYLSVRATRGAVVNHAADGSTVTLSMFHDFPVGCEATQIGQEMSTDVHSVPQLSSR
jgi:hypothetical protein